MQQAASYDNLISAIIARARQASLDVACREQGIGLDNEGLPEQTTALGRSLRPAVEDEMRRVCNVHGVK